MYAPVQIGVPRSYEKFIVYKEYPPDISLKDTVYCFWEFRTLQPLDDIFSYLVLPDGCIDIIFDLGKTPEFLGALIMTPSTHAETLDMQRQFSYIGVRLLPGSWHQSSPLDIVGKAHFYETIVDYSFTTARQSLLACTTITEMTRTLSLITAQLQARDIITASPFIKALLNQPILSVQDLMTASGYSRRQLQRVLHRSVGYSPHDFVKIIRFQRAVQNGKEAARQYSDQSHFIRECKRITRLTPTALRVKYRLTSL